MRSFRRSNKKIILADLEEILSSASETLREAP